VLFFNFAFFYIITSLYYFFRIYSSSEGMRRVQVGQKRVKRAQTTPVASSGPWIRVFLSIYTSILVYIYIYCIIETRSSKPVAHECGIPVPVARVRVLAGTGAAKKCPWVTRDQGGTGI
jgi:hypothetical protein